MTYEDERKRDFARLWAAIDGTSKQLEAKIAAEAAQLRDLQRQAHAMDKRRGGPGSLDARKYALGSVLAMLGLGDVDDTALLGLLSHWDQIPGLIDRLHQRDRHTNFAGHVRALLADPDIGRWCRQWGRVLQWRERAPLYQAEVERFTASGRTGPDERWRKRDITAAQLFLIRTLEELLGVTFPDSTESPATRGDAFDWIHFHGGNPTYWQEPPLPTNL